MTIELSLLAWAVVLGLVHAVATGQVTIAQHGNAYAMGPRDEQKPVDGVGGRVIRSFANYMQTFPFFAAAVLTAHAAGVHDWLTIYGAWIYLIARIAYVGLYIAGTPVVRTLAFLAGVVGIVMILVALA